MKILLIMLLFIISCTETNQKFSSNNKIELFAVCEKSKRLIVNKEELKNKRFWLRGWKDNLGIDNNSSLMDQLVEGTISIKQAAREVRQKARRKAEQRMLKKNDENKEL